MGYRVATQVAGMRSAYAEQRLREIQMMHDAEWAFARVQEADKLARWLLQHMGTDRPMTECRAKVREYLRAGTTVNEEGTRNG